MLTILRWLIGADKMRRLAIEGLFWRRVRERQNDFVRRKPVFPDELKTEWDKQNRLPNRSPP